ncbi:MAG: histidine phosphatase family protein [Candidatus Muirbacterium halophilum]|nr:histidine phosphatase family protein [Candidatus Muirbacterium halophilum]MCK9476591.1 histidine phosphatase family protein [Candidatus Muirbacterium halophilum]
MKELYLIRHGESEGNELGIIQGHQDFPLSKRGFEQAKSLGEYFLQKSILFENIFTSDSLRAKQTCGIIANLMKKDFFESEKLREMNLGVWQGKKKSDIFMDESIRKKWDNNPTSFFIDKAETFIEAQKRITNFIFNTLKENIITAYFGHGTTICLFLCGLFENNADKLWDYKHNNTGWTKILLNNDNKVLKVSQNITEHLEINTLNWF